MKLTHLSLQNFRQYHQQRFNFHSQFTIIIGNNGAGKTTILDALAIMLNTYLLGSGIKTGGGPIKAGDARLVLTEKSEQLFGEAQSPVLLQATASVGETTVDWQRGLGDRGGKAKEFSRLGVLDRAQLKGGGSPNLPLLLYYGVGRLWDVHSHVETEKPNSQLDAYRFCLDPKSDQKAFEKWFKKLTFSQIQKKRPIPALEAITKAVSICIPGAQAFYHDADFDQIMIKLEKEGWVPFNSLSAGYRNMVSMIADIAHRACRLNPHLGAEAALGTAGVVLIDEIDLHLHGKWQRRIVGDLKKAFPLLQFIGTTHSPFILQSLEPGEVIDLEQKPSAQIVAASPIGIAAPGPGQAFSDRSLEDIVENVMGVPVPQRSQRLQEMFDVAKEYYQTLEEAGTANTERKALLKARLDELSAPFSENVAYHAFLEMERLAAGLGSSKIPDKES